MAGGSGIAWSSIRSAAAVSERAPRRRSSVLPDRHEARVAADCGGVGRGRAFLDQVGEIVILAGGEAVGRERGEPHDRARAFRELLERFGCRCLVPFEKAVVQRSEARHI